jgi:hypothetical protein
MAGRARHSPVHADQRESGNLSVVEGALGVQWGPALSAVAVRAADSFRKGSVREDVFRTLRPYPGWSHLHRQNHANQGEPSSRHHCPPRWHVMQVKSRGR